MITQKPDGKDITEYCFDKTFLEQVFNKGTNYGQEADISLVISRVRDGSDILLRAAAKDKAHSPTAPQRSEGGGTPKQL